MNARAPTRVYCIPVSRDSAYVPLVFTGIEERYRPIYREDGSLRDAIAEIDSGRRPIVHIHWEEFVVRACSSSAHADAEAARFSSELVHFRHAGGTIVWTVHNELPHLIPFHSQFRAMRTTLAEHADAILVHNIASIDVLAAQVDLDRSKVCLLPHPSYLGRHEDDEALRAGIDTPNERRIQSFGWIRPQKGLRDMIEMLPADYLRSRGAHVRISGDGAEVAADIARATGRDDVCWDVRHVPDAEVPKLLRSAACVILPYERVLTSGVALLALSVGALLVAVDIPQIRELLPAENRRFLYPRGDHVALRRVLDDVFALAAEDRRTIVEANLAVARTMHPTEIARRLAAIYDGLSENVNDRTGSSSQDLR